MNLTTIDRVKLCLSETALSSGSSALISGIIIPGVSIAAERHLRRHVERKERTETYNVIRGQIVVFLRGYPVADTPEPEFRSDILREFTGAAIDPLYYSLDLENGIVEFDRTYLVYGAKCLQATYTGGLASSTAALVSSGAWADLVLGADLQCQYVFERRSELNLTNFSAEGGSLQMATAAGSLCVATRELWAPYRRTVGGL